MLHENMSGFGFACLVRVFKDAHKRAYQMHIPANGSHHIGRYAAQKCNSAATNCKEDENYQVNVAINNAGFKMLKNSAL